MTDPVYLTALLGLGLALKITGFAVRDELVLRLLVATGIVCDVLFYALRPEPILQSVLANMSLVAVNVALILLILLERTTWRMSAEDRALLRHFATLTPGQFRRIAKIMERETVGPDTPLTLENKPVEHLMLVFSDRIEISKQGKSFPVGGPAFVGEIAFLTGNPSSADVRLPEGGTVIRLPIGPLKAMMARKPALNNAMVALFGQELARKVADSVPMDRAARSRPVTGAAPSGDTIPAIDPESQAGLS
ncbi:cyclic nucleotide-binding protein domain protein [Roseibacterium elongatum DSM 19469]|uniref:Cyclic nucleotide-binding protein domain protein n=1 Tax=Roseicyclus elongatus DSM 19469 TaxID=1294273 RepID=W8SQG0_9RHOB|nr:cyclic nucleotide-binding domain-containing protein [Roseibacterium elongatum]AHM04780.1 cyclic nucleotide-binding protein domain protein [Roseibacterium elongatum DSM 19469]